MLMEQTLEKMNQMKLSAMVEALEQQRRANQYTDLGFEERITFLSRFQQGQHRGNIVELRIVLIVLRVILVFFQRLSPDAYLEEVFMKPLPPNPIGLRKEYWD